MSCTIRPYRHADRSAVRAICADTGFMGKPIDSIFCDRESFADFFTLYYTTYEPDCCLVTEDLESGKVVGYLLGCVRYYRRAVLLPAILLRHIVPRVFSRVILGHYDAQSRAFLTWVVLRSIHETPPAPPRAAHFHVNLLPAYRRGVEVRKMVSRFFEIMQERGVKRIYGQIQTREDRRTQFWRRYGFRELSRCEVTKFRHHCPETVYVTTLFRELEES